MIIYEVNLIVQKSIATEYKSWLSLHINQILQINGFVSANWYQIEYDDDLNEHWSIQYKLHNFSDLQDYLDNFSKQFREDGLKRFGNQFTSTRRVLKLIEKFNLLM
ncbi:MAG: DUF4286 family protein [Chlorobiota bacterium]|nr:DUF4286 family protein [Chlorobiota bacterium]QQS65606.1 MAG: DUF4286 family protein [Chlorobiota bacterium]